jgi:uncharacterized protein (DUF2267 family)
MTGRVVNGQSMNREVTFDDVERVLAVGRLLLSVLTPEELEWLRDTFVEERASRETPRRSLEKKVTLASLDA